MQYIPTVFVKESTVWEYQTVERDSAEPLSVDDLNKQGNDGWELAALLPTESQLIYYFKRLI